MNYWDLPIGDSEFAYAQADRPILVNQHDKLARKSKINISKFFP